MSTLTRILVVDNNPLNVEIINQCLQRDGYRVIRAASGPSALALMQQHDIDLVLLDILLPERQGYELLQQLKTDVHLRHTPVIIISNADDQTTIAHCIASGADDYLTKPINAVLLRARVNSSLDKKRLHDSESHYRHELELFNSRLQAKIQAQVNEIVSAHLGAIFATSKLAESKDPETGAHLERLRVFCKLLAEDLAGYKQYAADIDQEFINCIYAASPLHDIGKVGIPDNVLLKPGKLDTQEWVVMRQHTIIGANTLRAVAEKHPGNGFIQMGIEIAECHHEKWDGSGYPHGLCGEKIPLAARILALADVYDALTSVRCYKAAFSHAQSRQIILEGAGKHFDPAIVQAFLRCERAFIDTKQRYTDDADEVHVPLEPSRLLRA
ncbi:MAG: response regulator [Gammaproteobacteria bacterium]|nr:response regulator [Gammaproteobacteria bacterium]